MSDVSTVIGHIGTGRRPPFVGILGGMGPLAGVDFAAKLVEAGARVCGASRDQEQVPFVLWSVPQIPPRVDALADAAAPSPLPAMIVALEALDRLGVDVIAVACNTAHAWYGEMVARVDAPIIHIADAAVATVPNGVKCVALMATTATQELGFYQERLARRGMATVLPTEDEMRDLVKPAIAMVKRGIVKDGVPLLERAIVALKARGAEAVVLGCTEIPVVMSHESARPALRVIDATAALAEACVRAPVRAQGEPAGHVVDLGQSVSTHTPGQAAGEVG